MKNDSTIRTITKIAILAAISVGLFELQFPLAFFPPFLQLDISDLPALIAGFSLGPVAGVLVTLIKNLLHLLQTRTGGVGELSNFLIAATMVYTSASIYRKHKSLKSAIAGMICGVLGATLLASITNYYIMLPFYSKIMPIELIINQASTVNSLIKDKLTLIIFAIIPFNLLKMSILSLVTALVYKRISPILKR